MQKLDHTLERPRSNLKTGSTGYKDVIKDLKGN
jgi:hypothetical protein